MKWMAGLFLMIAMWTVSAPVCALETDQYTPPPRPLVNLGKEFDLEIERTLREVVDSAESKRLEHLRRTPDWPAGLKRNHLAKAEKFRSEAYIARAAFLALSRSGTPQNRMEAFFRYGSFDPQTTLHRVKAGESVYGSFRRPITIQTLSPTIHLHGIYLGTDKLGHFFEQGFEYYEEYAAELARTKDERRATRKAITHGVQQEKTYYGMMIDGVYSNADLAANFAGFLFYLNLTRPVEIGGVIHEPMLVLKEYGWEVNREKGSLTLRHFITDHLNEALNPSRFSRPLREIVQQSARGLSQEWLEFYGLSAEEYRRRSAELRTFFGRAYGHADTETYLAAR